MRRIALGVLVVAVVGTAAGWFGLRRERGSPKPQGRAVQVTEGAIEETVDATGSVVPLNRVEVRPPIGGRVERLLVQEGDAVKAGQIVAWMSSNDRAAILDAARARGPSELSRWEDAYKPTPIVAPLSGAVILRNVVVGQTVETNNPLFALADTLVVVAQVDESEIGRVKLGMPARLTLDAYPSEPFAGKVFDILYEGKNVSNVITYGVKLKPERAPSFLRSQMTTNVSFIVRRKERAVLAPAAAIRQRSDGTKVALVPGPDGKPAPREVTTGVESGDRVEILSGLEPGEAVVFGRGRYAPEAAAQSSPLMFGGPRNESSPSRQAPRRRGGGGGS